MHLGITYVPHYRYRCGFDGQAIYKPNWKLGLGPAQAALVRVIDGQRTIAEILETARDLETSVPEIREPCHFTRELFRSLWQTDYLAFEIITQKPSTKPRRSKDLNQK